MNNMPINILVVDDHSMVIEGMKAILPLSLAVFSRTAGARELQGRFGIGYNAQFKNLSTAGGVPGVSLKYGLSRDIGTEFVFGTSTGTPLR